MIVKTVCETDGSSAALIKLTFSENCLQNRAVLSAEEGGGGDQLPGGGPEPVHRARGEVPTRGGQDGAHTLHAGPATNTEVSSMSPVKLIFFLVDGEVRDRVRELLRV